MLEMYLIHKQNEMNQNNHINMQNLAKEDESERLQTFTLLFSSLRYHNQNRKKLITSNFK